MKEGRYKSQWKDVVVIIVTLRIFVVVVVTIVGEEQTDITAESSQVCLCSYSLWLSVAVLSFFFVETISSKNMKQEIFC